MFCYKTVWSHGVNNGETDPGKSECAFSLCFFSDVLAINNQHMGDYFAHSRRVLFCSTLNMYSKEKNTFQNIRCEKNNILKILQSTPT